MFQYRDFSNDPNTFDYQEGQAFLSQLNANGQHYIPIVDSAIYIPNPNNASDNYSIYTDGNDRGVFLSNPDGSQYIGSVWVSSAGYNPSLRDMTADDCILRYLLTCTLYWGSPGTPFFRIGMRSRAWHGGQIPCSPITTIFRGAVSGSTCQKFLHSVWAAAAVGTCL